MISPPRVSRRLVLAVALVAAVFLAYASVVHNAFINFDDEAYLVGNPQLHQGFTPASLRWAFTTTTTGNWLPLTWLSHMLDFRLFGRWAGGHHAVSVVIHAANTALLFGVLSAMTGAFWRSALVAALFGLHPLRVESVAWAAERKDVLMILFGVLAIGAYLRYVRHRTKGAYAATLGLYACSLMCKAMLVTLPGILLLLDLWPLNRWTRLRGAACLPGRPLLLEKAPFLALAAAASGVAYAAQSAGNAVGNAVQFPFGQRIGNAFTAYCAYILKTLWPANLATPYPYSWNDVPWWQPLLGAALVVAGSAFTLYFLGRRPAWFVGWAWYLGTLLPVIGIVQVGSQAMADRYTYFPQIGVLILFVWGLGELTEGRPRATAAVAVAATVVITASIALTATQVAYWRTSATLFSHAVQVTRNNFVAYSNLGMALIDEGREDEGRELVARALKLSPDFRAAAFEGNGDYLAGLGRAREAQAEYRKAQELAPGKRSIQDKLRALGDVTGGSPVAPAADLRWGAAPADDPLARGNRLMTSGRLEAAVSAFREAIRAAPGNYSAWHNLGCAYGDLGRLEEAAGAFEEALRLKPDHQAAKKNLEVIRASRGRRN